MNLWTIYADVEKVSQFILPKGMKKSGSEQKLTDFKIQARFDESIVLTFDLPVDHRYDFSQRKSFLNKTVFRIAFTLNNGRFFASSEIICVDTISLAVLCDGYDILKCTVKFKSRVWY